MKFAVGIETMHILEVHTDEPSRKDNFFEPFRPRALSAIMFVCGEYRAGASSSIKVSRQ